MASFRGSSASWHSPHGNWQLGSSARSFAMVVAVVALGSVIGACSGPNPSTTSSASAPSPADARANPFIQGNQSPPIPAGPPGKVAVVASGALAQLIQPEGPSSLTIPIVIRNNTTATQDGIQVSATAKNNGTLVNTGSSQGNFIPLMVKSGQIAIGYVYFQSLPPTTATIDYSVTTGNSTTGRVNLTVTASNTVPVAGGYLNLVGQVKNQTNSKIHAAARVFGICFDSSGQPTGDGGTYTDAETLAPGAVSAFSSQISGVNTPCVSWLVGSDAFTF
jgi:hypothetical protein